jgi:hypothetical protein
LVGDLINYETVRQDFLISAKAPFNNWKSIGQRIKMLERIRILIPFLLARYPMADEKDRFGEAMKLAERAKEDIYFAERDRELIEKLKTELKKVEKGGSDLRCPKCPGQLEAHTFQGFALDRCQSCGGIWMDKGELEGVIRKMTRGPEP